MYTRINHYRIDEKLMDHVVFSKRLYRIDRKFIKMFLCSEQDGRPTPQRTSDNVSVGY